VRTSRAGTESGFTLLELVVVVAILGLVFAIVPVSFRGAIAQAELAAAARDVAASLRRARTEAIARQRETPVEFDLDARRYAGVDGRVRAFPDGATVSLYTAEVEALSQRAAAIRFFPDGGASGGRVTLARAGRTYFVEVEWLTGRVRVHE
jgi:general secretion pathway protein H